MNIMAEISTIKGVGPKAKIVLNELGIFSVLDLLLYFPRDYENVSTYADIQEAQDGEKINVKGIVTGINKDYRTKNGMTITKIAFKSNDVVFYAQWFNQPYMKNSFRIGQEYDLSGKVKYLNNTIIINNPLQNTNKLNINKNIYPKYKLKEGITNNFLIKIIKNILLTITISENLPSDLVNKYKLSDLDFSIRNIHFPDSSSNLLEARRRLKFQELLTYSLKILSLRHFLNTNNEGISFQISSELNELKKNLPFELTQAQNRVIREVLMDEKSNKPMSRLIQGDVGSGKTIVALIALFNVVMNKYQGALMAPTEILAEQHFKEFTKILKDFPIKIELLTGSIKNKEKERIKESLKNGEIDILIGTHALIESNVEFKNIGMIITDEQHRFGVSQRNKLLSKGKNIDVLVMTATPIPRTLSLYLYGDLDVSVIDELPPGREKIETYYIDEKERDRVYKFAQKQIEEGRQVYVVCPLVEENKDLDLNSVENMYEELKNKYFNDVEIAIIHGKMSSGDKKAIMDRYSNNEIKVLVSTTVIEVGINVPNANLMIIENAERFGLAQLHQLRGRVGRGKYKSYCILCAKVKNNVVKKRMEIMKNSNDGFYIANQDLLIRGNGDIFGYNQSGENGLILSDVMEDIEILKIANEEAKRIINSSVPEDRNLREYIIDKLKNNSTYICFN